MTNAIPPPAQRLINCFRDASANPSKTCVITCVALAIIFLGALVTSGLGLLGLSGNIPQNLEIPLITLFTGLIVLFGVVMSVLVFRKHCPINNRSSQQRNIFIVPPRPIPQPVFLPRPQRIPSIDSGMGFDNSLLDSPSLDRSRRNTTTSSDSGINIDMV